MNGGRFFGYFLSLTKDPTRNIRPACLARPHLIKKITCEKERLPDVLFRNGRLRQWDNTLRRLSWRTATGAAWTSWPEQSTNKLTDERSSNHEQDLPKWHGVNS
jgi:hypothetical protein